MIDRSHGGLIFRSVLEASSAALDGALVALSARFRSFISRRGDMSI